MQGAMDIFRLNNPAICQNQENELLSTNKSGKQGVYYMEKYKFWAVEYRDKDGKKKCKRFYVGSKRDYDEAQRLAMEFQA